MFHLDFAKEIQEGLKYFDQFTETVEQKECADRFILNAYIAACKPDLTGDLDCEFGDDDDYDYDFDSMVVHREDYPHIPIGAGDIAVGLLISEQRKFVPELSDHDVALEAIRDLHQHVDTVDYTIKNLHCTMQDFANFSAPLLKDLSDDTLNGLARNGQLDIPSVVASSMCRRNRPMEYGYGYYDGKLSKDRIMPSLSISPQIEAIWYENLFQDLEILGHTARIEFLEYHLRCSEFQFGPLRNNVKEGEVLSDLRTCIGKDLPPVSGIPKMFRAKGYTRHKFTTNFNVTVGFVYACHNRAAKTYEKMFRIASQLCQYRTNYLQLTTLAQQIVRDDNIKFIAHDSPYNTISGEIFGNPVAAVKCMKAYNFLCRPTMHTYAQFQHTHEWLLTLNPSTMDDIRALAYTTARVVDWPLVDELQFNLLPRLAFMFGPLAIVGNIMSPSWFRWLSTNIAYRYYCVADSALQDKLAKVVVVLYKMPSENVKTFLKKFKLVVFRLKLVYCELHSHYTYVLPAVPAGMKITIFPTFVFPDGDVLAAASQEETNITKFGNFSGKVLTRQMDFALRHYILQTVFRVNILSNGGFTSVLIHHKEVRNALRDPRSSIESFLPGNDIYTLRYIYDTPLNYNVFRKGYYRLLKDLEVKHNLTVEGVEGLVGVLLDVGKMKQMKREKVITENMAKMRDLKTQEIFEKFINRETIKKYDVDLNFLKWSQSEWTFKDVSQWRALKDVIDMDPEAQLTVINNFKSFVEEEL